MIAESQENRGYFVTDAAGQKVEVYFETLTVDDSDALNGDDWQGARFDAVWKEWAEHHLALKLLRCDGSHNAILGLVKIGVIERKGGKSDVLRDSLLESAPVHQFRSEDRRYRGIGRVLVARLITASKMQEAKGRVLVRPAEGTLPFYKRLGFVTSVDKKYYRLNIAQAEALLVSCLIPARKAS